MTVGDRQLPKGNEEVKPAVKRAVRCEHVVVALRPNCSVPPLEGGEAWVGVLGDVTVRLCGASAPDAHGKTMSDRIGSGPQGGLVCKRRHYDGNHGTEKVVATKREKKNRGHLCHGVSFQQGRGSVCNEVMAVRCSPGQGTCVYLVRCKSNRGECVLRPEKTVVKSAVISNARIPVGVKGTLPLDTI